MSEKTEYDGQVYHQNCFKCLECRRQVSLTAVAMIKGDLYCKNCFMRIFKSAGRYSDFGDKTLPKAGAGAGASTDKPAAAAPAAPAATPAAAPTAAPVAAAPVAAAPAATAAVPASERRQSVALPQSSQDLFEAISGRNVGEVEQLLAQEQSAAILFRTNQRGMTPIEAAFTGIQNSRACGEAMLSWLQKKVAALEQANAGAAAQE